LLLGSGYLADLGSQNVADPKNCLNAYLSGGYPPGGSNNFSI